MKGRNHKAVPGMNEEKEYEKGKFTLAETIVTWILMFLCVGFLLSMLTGCGETKVIAVNVESSEAAEPLSNDILGIDALIKIGNFLYYDSTTRIVYWWNGYRWNNAATTPTPYYSPNGLLYKYIPETNSLEEIKPLKIAE